MRISDVGLELIKRFEGFRAKKYICAAGYPTIGIGHVLKKGEDYDVITEAFAIELLRQDVKIAEYYVGKLITKPLTQCQFDALVSFTFNCGGGALQRSSLRSKINRGEFSSAANEFLKWNRGGGRVLKGLTKRRQAERELFLAESAITYKEQKDVF